MCMQSLQGVFGKFHVPRDNLMARRRREPKGASGGFLFAMALKSTASFLAVIMSVIALAGCSRASSKEHVAKTPESAVEQFYEWRLRNPSMALPTQEQLAQMKPYVTNELYELLVQAQARASK